MSKHIKATAEAGKEFYLKFLQNGEAIVMLNLLKFKSKADYTGLELLKPKEEITGEEAYKLYTNNTLDGLKRIGSEILFYGESKNFLIGPNSEKWDVVLLVKHQSVQSFIEFAKSKVYLNNVGHRTAGLEDSRLLPTTEITNYI
ncbi:MULTISPECIES: hypothetical protein [Cellulophaga]|uniref:DUF1330 domain-containing protein n=1 Tax=Cellulophaga baltica 18 TaxID=1348584 RepID=A0AAU8RD31_9FLAO|nr:MULTISPECIES: hypothetical protein [Cellulophaga]AIZ40960.1 hypothetical protein M666_04955 [Cellulophaga baltica 18]KGK28689.1 hypothetical protein EL45_19480 [Cellulophaga sp. E6(2014)]WFO15035.1 DUF1330 domain-containing protein [Cellulophaga baltica 4]